MFIFLNKIIRKAKLKISGSLGNSAYSPFAAESSRRGQIAVLIVVFIAITFIFLTIVLNLGRVSQTKTLTTVASNVSASFMASAMTSYSEQMYQMQLGGPDRADDDLTVCGWTGVAGAILSVLVIVASFFLPGSTPLALAIVSVILAVGSLVLQLVIVNPGLTDLWNKLFAEIKSPADQFVERGILAALQNSIDDNKQIDDALDIDQDNLYGSNDKASRFGYYYTLRLRNSIPNRVADIAVIQGFMDALREFLNRGTDNWGVWNQLDCSANPSHVCCNANPPAECNPCCAPNGQGGDPDLRPDCCDDGSCPYGASSSSCPGISTPYVYDFLYEVNQNRDTFPAGQFFSLREFFSHDDENRRATYNSLATGGQSSDADNKWRVNDAKGGVYPLLWNAGAHMFLNRSDEHRCRWSDEKVDGVPGGNCTAVNSGLSLPNCEQSYLSGATNCALPVNADRVTDLPTQTALVPARLPSNSCFEIGAFRNDNQWKSDLNAGWWKEGANRYCSEQYPYRYTCPGQYCFGPSGYINPPPTCTCCGEAPCCDITQYPGSPGGEENSCSGAGLYKPYWVGDSVDQIRYEFDDFIVWAKENLDADVQSIAAGFLAWYPEVKRWIEPSSGMLHIWAVSMDKWREDLVDWRNRSYPRQSGSDLCPTSNLPSQSYLPNIIACYSDKATEEQNNADAFDACYNACLPLCVGTPPCSLTSCSGNCRASCNSFSSPAHPTFGNVTPAFVCNVWRAYVGATTKVLKYQARHDFLQYTYTQIGAETESPAVHTAARLREARDKIGAFLNDPRVRALETMYNDLNSQIDPQFEPYAVYVWQSDPPKGRDEGYWHIVRVDTRLPGRCAGRCGRKSLGNWPEPGWPWVKTYTKNWGTRRCYTLGDSFDRYPDGTSNEQCNETDDYAHNERECFRGGTVKARVIRYDEDKDTLLKFANAVPIWRFVSYHPLRGAIDPTLVQQMAEACDPDGKGAFMLNDVTTSSPWPEQRACWDKVIPLLERGVMSKTCAEYFFHNRPPYGFNLKFTKCQDPF